MLVAAEQWNGAAALSSRRALSRAARRAPARVAGDRDAEGGDASTRPPRVATSLASWTSAPIVRVAFALDALRRVGAPEETRPTRRGSRGVRCWRWPGSARRAHSPGNSRKLGRASSWYRFQIIMRSRRATSTRSCVVPPSDGAVVCTLKDAVKLDALWPRASTPLWYVSQRLALEAGQVEYIAAIQRALDARRALQITPPTAGSAGPLTLSCQPISAFRRTPSSSRTKIAFSTRKIRSKR